MISETIASELLRRNEKFPHREHQLVGLLKLLEMPTFCLFDEVGAGKTKQIIDTSQVLFLHHELDTVLVLTPGFARSTWADEDPDLGEVAKHAWDNVPNVIHEYHKDYDELGLYPNSLNWVVSNYEFVRRDDRCWALDKQLRGRKTWLVLDESWALKGNSDQMKAVRRLRNRRSVRATLLNGTPLSDGKPEDLYYPLSILDPAIIGTPTKASFRAKYCVMGGFDGKKVVGYQNLDDLNQRVAPYVLSRRTRDCFDLPPMLDPITIEARLSNSTWALYKDMRDEMVGQLGNQISTASQAIVKSLRLAQLCSGFLGGLQDLGDDEEVVNSITSGDTSALFGAQPQWLRSIHEQAATVQGEDAAGTSAPDPQHPGGSQASPAQQAIVGRTASGAVREVSREKLDALLSWLDMRGTLPHKLLVWTRFTPDLLRCRDELAKVYPHVFELRGKVDKGPAKAFLAPGSDPRSGAVVGNPKAGGASLNFSASNIAVYLSNGPALIERTQSIGRIERPGATQPMLIVDVLATGPKGQKTFDHRVLKALRSKDDMARWSVEQWRQILRDS